jgi:HK97 family phage major capsid protein
MISRKCLAEVREMNTLAKELRARGKTTEAADLEKRAQAINDTGFSTDELREMHTANLLDESGASAKITQASPEYREAFYRYLATGEEQREFRDVLVGGGGDMSIAYTQLSQGGPLVPIETEQRMFEAIAQTDPLLSDQVVDFWMSPTPYVLKPHVLTGVDLSSVAAQNIAETVKQSPQAVPTVAGKTLRGNIGYRFALAASIEAETDIPNWLAKYARIAGVAFARTIGKDAAFGNGGLNTPAGLFPFLGPSVYQTGTGKITLTDINTIFYKVDAAYRAQPKCAWVMSDAVYQRLRNAVDASNRPLIDVADGTQTLIGKPIYISPSMSNSLLSEGFGALIFGDLDHFHVRVSKPYLKREINSGRPGYSQVATGGIEFGECLYVSRIKMDCSLFDPSALSNPPIVWAAVTQ